MQPIAIEIFEKPELFCNLIGFKLFDYQKKILNDASKRIVMCCGRQVGKSTIAAIKALHFAFSKPKTTTLVVSATLRQSMLLFDRLLDVIESSLLRRSIAYRSRTRIKLSNGSWIIALPSGRWGSTLRGHTANLVIIDETSFIPEEVIANVVFPMISTTNGYAWLLSTPWDKGHIFYKCFTSPEWSVHHLPSSSNPLIKPEFLEEQRKLIGEERFRMEYLAEFVDDTKSYFPMALLRTCVEDLELWPRETNLVSNDFGGERYAGYDPGGKESLSAFVVVERVQDKIIARHIRTDRERNYATVNAEIADYCNALGVTELCVDQTGLGNPIVEHLKELGTSVEGLVLTQKTKEELFSNLKILLEQRKIVISNNNELLNALNCVEYERTRTGNYAFSHRQGTYDDLAFALALACWGAKGPSGKMLVKL